MEELKKRTQEIIDYLAIGNKKVAEPLLLALLFEVDTQLDNTTDSNEIIELSKYKALLELLNKKV